MHLLLPTHIHEVQLEEKRRKRETVVFNMRQSLAYLFVFYSVPFHLYWNKPLRMGFSIKNEWEEEVNRCMQMRVWRGEGGGGSGERRGRGGQGDECSSPDKGVCILQLGEKQKE